jgi:hypothetical protein
MTTTLSAVSECIYLIRDNETGLHKIGMTTNWPRRSRELQVGGATTAIRTWACPDAMKWERVLHSQFKHKRLPQSEWFRVTEDEVLPKVQWLMQRVDYGSRQFRGVIGQWKQAQAGHFYRRRRSQSGHWYTQTAGREQVLSQARASVESVVNESANRALYVSRSEPGYWPTKEDPTQLVWAEKDPTLGLEKLMGFLILGGIATAFAGLLMLNGNLIFIGVIAVLFGIKASK